MTRSTPPQAPRAPVAAPVVLRHGVEWYAGGAWSASVRTWPTRREAAEEAGRVVRAFGPAAQVVLLVACPRRGPSWAGGRPC